MTEADNQATNQENNAQHDKNGEQPAYPVPTNFSKHLWLFLLIVLSVCVAAIISWLAKSS